MIFSWIFVQAIPLFQDNIWKNVPIFVNFPLFERSAFHLGTIVNFISMREFKVCMFIVLSICLGYKSTKNWSVLSKFGYVYALSNFSLCTENCDHMLDTFYRGTSKSWTFVFIHVPLLISLCNNTNVMTRTVSITSL